MTAPIKMGKGHEQAIHTIGNTINIWKDDWLHY